MTLPKCTALLSQSALAAVTTIGLTTIGTVACGHREPATDADRLARGRELVQQMSTRLAAAKELSVATTEVRDVVRRSGAKERVSLTGLYTMRRPDRFHSKVSGGKGLESWYDGKMVTVAVAQDKVFAQAPMPETIDRTLDALAERYDMALPLGDLFYSSAEKALLSDTTTGGYAGPENVGDTPCHHLAFRDAGVEWDIWLPVQGEPLPARLKVVNRHRSGEPVTDVTFTRWNLAPQLSAAMFTPSVPADYEGIAILQRTAAVKAASTATSAASGAPLKK
jgi:hypothetical protein